MDEHDSKPESPVIRKVAVGICLKGHTPPESYHDRMMMAYHMGCREVEDHYLGKSPRYQFLWFSAGEIFVAFARDQLAHMALAHGCDYLFMVDDDMMCPPDFFFKLAARDVDMVAPLAFTRNPPHHAVMYSVRNGFDPVERQPYYQTEYVNNYPRNKLVECDAVGFGSVLIKTNVFRIMARPWFMSTSPTGEDVLFCNKAKKLGFRVFMDTSVKLGHLSHPLVVTEDYVDKYHGLTEEEREKQYGSYNRYPTMEIVK